MWFPPFGHFGCSLAGGCRSHAHGHSIHHLHHTGNAYRACEKTCRKLQHIKMYTTCINYVVCSHHMLFCSISLSMCYCGLTKFFGSASQHFLAPAIFFLREMKTTWMVFPKKWCIWMLIFYDFLFQESCSISTLWSCLLPCTTPRTSPKAACRSWWLSSSCIWWSDPARRWGTMSSSPRTWAWSGELDSMATSSKKLLGNNLCC